MKNKYRIYIEVEAEDEDQAWNIADNNTVEAIKNHETLHSTFHIEKINE
jgi:hypothetical protein